MKELKDINKLLICVDMVNGFVKEGPMADPFIAHIVPENIKLMEEIKKEAEGLATVKDTHKSNAIEFKRYPIHCVENTKEAELIDELKRFEEGSLVYKKNSTSTIYAKGFLDFVNSLPNLEEVTIVGCCTDICIFNLAIPLQNYFDQIDKDVRIIVPKDMVETYDAPNHPRDEYNSMAFKLIEQAGIEI